MIVKKTNYYNIIHYKSEIYCTRTSSKKINLNSNTFQKTRSCYNQ